MGFLDLFKHIDINTEIENMNSLIPNLETPVYVYCLRGTRSASAVKAMEKMGYKNAKSIGGIASYKGTVETVG